MPENGGPLCPVQIRDVNKALMEIGQEMEDDGRQQLGQTRR
jgi:hypothetical protein